MHNNEKVSTIILLQISVIALSIFATCILVILYLFDIISFYYLERIKVKALISLITFFALIFFTIYYIIGKSIKNVKWNVFILFSIYFEIFGYWWLNHLLGHLFMAIGLILLIIGLHSIYKFGL